MSLVYFHRCAIIQRLVRAFMVVKPEVHPQAEFGVLHRMVLLYIHLLIFHRAPQPFDEYVIQRPPSAIHADGYVMLFQHTGKGFRGELAALVAIENLRSAVFVQGVLQSLNAKARIHCVGESPGQHATAEPIDNRDQVGESSAYPNIGDVG